MHDGKCVNKHVWIVDACHSICHARCAYIHSCYRDWTQAICLDGHFDAKLALCIRITILDTTKSVINALLRSIQKDIIHTNIHRDTHSHAENTIGTTHARKHIHTHSDHQSHLGNLAAGALLEAIKDLLEGSGRLTSSLVHHNLHIKKTSQMTPYWTSSTPTCVLEHIYGLWLQRVCCTRDSCAVAPAEQRYRRSCTCWTKIQNMASQSLLHAW